MSDNQGFGYDLVMPFLPVRSRGGPYDDDAYVAGYEMGVLDAAMELGAITADKREIHTDNVAQADLIAMRYGYTAKWGEPVDGWTPVEFIPPAGVK